MIKGLGYLKYLKLCLIGFGISCFMGLGVNSVSATSQGFIVGNDKFLSNWSSNYNIGFLPKGRFLTDYLGTTKAMIGLNNQYFYFWNDIGLYFFNTSAQGYLQYMFSCDEIDLNGTGVMLQNCGDSQKIDLPSEVLSNFLSTIQRGDIVYITEGGDSHGCGGYCSYYMAVKTVCFSSQAVGKTMCLIGSYIPTGPSYQHYNIAPLTGSLDLPNTTNFSNLSRSLLTEPPGFTPGYSNGGEGIDGSSTTGDYNITTGNTMNVNITKRTALDWYRCNGYKTRMCYSSYGNVSDLYTGPGNATSYDLTGVDIEDVRFDSAWYRRNGLTGDSMGYVEWFKYWRKTYNAYIKNPQHTNPFLGVPVAIFTLMGNINAYGLPYTDDSIIEFCDLSLYTANYNAPYTGVAYNAVSQMSAIDLIDCKTSNELNPDDGNPGNNGQDTVGPVGSSRDGITNRTGYHNKPGVSQTGEVASGSDLNMIGDGKTFENNFFNKLSQNFRFPDDSSGGPIIPSYIILVMCALVFFRFISH